ncbi:MAG: LacI family DNA-binding transcriptional regulator [Gammaproteobacteria bacterium]
MSRTNKSKVTTLQDLADLAGVSRATASRALNNSPKISDKTKAKLKALAQKHNYAINRQARDFRLRRSSVIAVVFMLDIRSRQHMSDPFFLDMLGGIADRLSEHDYDLLLVHAPIVNVLDLRSSRVLQQSDGVIFIGQGKQHEQLKALAEDNDRIVVWGYPVSDKNYTIVGGDNKSGGYQSTKHLLELGRRNIAFFGDIYNPENAARHEGYRQALSEYGLEPDPRLRIDVPVVMEGARAAMLDIIDSGVIFDAVVCVSDVVALASLSTFQEKGIRVPSDVAVVGYDDIRLAAYSSPPLTTVRQHIHEAGETLVDSVLGLINGEQVTDTILTSELIVRKSSGV